MWVIVFLFVLGVIAAFPLAIGICTLLGGLLMTIDWLTTRCPNCWMTRCMRMTDAIRETYPTGRGTGRFYLCRNCGQRSFWSNDDRAWQDASDADFDWAFRRPSEKVSSRRNLGKS